jgi:hypothetical protein
MQKMMDSGVNTSNNTRGIGLTEISSNKGEGECWYMVCGIQYKAGEDWVQCRKCEDTTRNTCALT